MHIRATYSLITLLLAILMAGCSVSKDRFRLNGKFKNLHTAEIYIYSEEGRDTIRIQGGKFVYEKKLSRPMILTIQYPNFAEMKIVAEPGKETKFVTDAADLTQTKLSGSDENKLLSDFYYDINDKRGAEIELPHEPGQSVKVGTVHAVELLGQAAGGLLLFKNGVVRDVGHTGVAAFDVVHKASPFVKNRGLIPV